MKKLVLLQKNISVRFVIDEIAFFLTPSTPELTLTDEQFEKIIDQLKALPKDTVEVQDVLFVETSQGSGEIVTELKEDDVRTEQVIEQKEDVPQVEDAPQRSTRSRTRKG